MLRKRLFLLLSSALFSSLLYIFGYSFETPVVLALIGLLLSSLNFVSYFYMRVAFCTITELEWRCDETLVDVKLLFLVKAGLLFFFCILSNICFLLSSVQTKLFEERFSWLVLNHQGLFSSKPPTSVYPLLPLPAKNL